MSSTTLQLVAAFEFVILLLLLFDLTLTLMWLQPKKFFTNILNVVEVHKALLNLWSSALYSIPTYIH